MKLLGLTDGKKVIASLSNHHCVTCNDMMMDGGQVHTNSYSSYNRFSTNGTMVWFEVEQEFDVLWDMWNRGEFDGIWDASEVKLLKKAPKITTAFCAENYIWGTRGVDGDQRLKWVLLKNCTKDHLQNILKSVSNIAENTTKIIKYLIKKK
jgi:hypothetical protein